MTNREGWASAGDRKQALALALGSAFAVAVLATLLMMLAGVHWPEATRGSAVIAIQCATGILLYLLLVRPSRISAVEAIGFGLPIGTFLSMLSFMVLREQSWITPWAWLLPTLLAVIATIFIRRPRASTHLPSPRQSALLVSLIALGCAFLAPFWRKNPIQFDGWVAYYPDLSFHETASHSLINYGPSTITYLAGAPFRYHWFADAWAGLLTQTAHLSPYVALSRSLYVTSIIASLCLAWAWAERLSTNRLAPPIAALMLVAGTFIGLGPNYSYSMFLTDISPTHTFAMPILLALSITITEYLRNRMGHTALVLLVLLGAALYGTRTFDSLEAFAAMGVVALANLRRPRILGRLVLAGVAVVLGTLPVHVLVVSGLGSAINNELVLRINSAISNLYGFTPYSGPGGDIFGYIALVLAVTAGWSGLLYLARMHAGDLSIPLAWAFGVGAAGLIAVAVVYHWGLSQISALWIAATVALPISGIGIAEGMTHLRARLHLRRPALGITLLVVVGAAATTVSLLKGPFTQDFVFAGYLRWASPVGIWILALIIGLVLARRSGDTQRRGVTVAVMGLVLGSASVFATVLALPFQWASAGVPVTRDTPIAINRDHLQAAEWVRANIPANDGLFATNRMCDVGTATPTECVSTSFITSALTGHATLIEGWSSGINSMPEWAQQRVMNSWNFAAQSDPGAAEYLQDQGVRWFWLDTGIHPAALQPGAGEVVYRNDSVTILQLPTRS